MNQDILDVKKEIKLTFANGEESIIDKEVYKLIIDLQHKAKNSKQLPFFWNLSQSLEGYIDIFLEFYKYVLSNYKLSKSQIYQDLFVLFNFNEKKNGTFLEFGATDGVEFSNSFLLDLVLMQPFFY